MRTTLIRVAALLALASGLPAVALAQGHDRDRDHGDRFEHRDGDRHWHGDIGRFHEHDWGVWRGGRWVHDRHDGRWGWWWLAGGTWYFYPQPVYPYPNPYEPPAVELVTPAPDAPPPPPRVWYYCDAARGYYPYVPTCPSGWREVQPSP